MYTHIGDGGVCFERVNNLGCSRHLIHSICQTLVTGSPAALFEGNGFALLAITSAGQVHSWYACISFVSGKPTIISPGT